MIPAACDPEPKEQFPQRDTHVPKLAFTRGQSLLFTIFALTICSGFFFFTFAKSNEHISKWPDDQLVGHDASGVRYTSRGATLKGTSSHAPLITQKKEI